jgi:hypothetical protein
VRGVSSRSQRAPRGARPKAHPIAIEPGKDTPMKKTKKLALHRETVRRLSNSQAETVAGGRRTDVTCDTTDGINCPTNHPVGCGGQTNQHQWC